MYVSAETIAVLGIGVTLLVAMFGGFGFVLNRMDRRFERVDERFDRVDEKFDKVDERFARVDEKFAQINSQFADITRELTEVKVAVARIEGPRPQFIHGH